MSVPPAGPGPSSIPGEGFGTQPPPPPPPQPQQVPQVQQEPEPAQPQQVNTANTALQDGVNRCPKCGSTDIQLRVSTGMLVCLFCRHEWSEAKIEPMVSGEVPLWDLTGTTVASGASDISPEVSGVMTLKCSGCGSEVVVNTAEAMSSRCHWCRHVLTINEQIPNGAVPDAVLPFSITRDQALANIKQFAGKRQVFAHKAFRSGFTPENVVGVYLPYLVIDANASAEVWGQGEIETARYTRKVGDHEETYYNADVYQVQRHVDYTVDDLTIESSAERANMNAFVNTNNIINTILPFDTENAVQWNANYLVGYTSERRDQDVSQVEPVLEDQLLSIARAQVENSMRAYDRGVRWEAEHLDVHGSRWVAMYLPVWLYSFYQPNNNGGMVHYIAVNGRTGETMGSVPVAQARLITFALAIGVVVEALVLVMILGVLL
ncbi:MAG TPA: hypothetical protein DCM67_04145 [Propionibacteriaceae bacterium]|nr:hypothetical protein [Propionibacteriaceae bacterium]